MSKYFNGDKLSGYEDSPITYVYGGNLEECHKVISDLEAKLAESNESHYKNIVELTKMATEKDRKIEELKQQLAEKEHTIKTLIEDSKASKELLKKQLAEKDEENNELVFIIEEIEQFAWEQLNNENFDRYKAYDEMLTKIKQLTKNSPYENRQQDKISFAVEKLQEAKRLLEEKYTYDVEESDFAVIYEDDVDEIIDNQIKQLKEKK